jgi:hypothetical protein
MKAVALVLVLGLLGGCFHSAVGMSSSTRPYRQGGYQELGQVSESDCLWKLFGLIPFSRGNSLQGATRDAIKQKAGADGLIQVTAAEFFQFFILFSRSCVKVSGIAVRSLP